MGLEHAKFQRQELGEHWQGLKSWRLLPLLLVAWIAEDEERDLQTIDGVWQ